MKHSERQNKTDNIECAEDKEKKYKYIKSRAERQEKKWTNRKHNESGGNDKQKMKLHEGISNGNNTKQASRCLGESDQCYSTSVVCRGRWGERHSVRGQGGREGGRSFNLWLKTNFSRHRRIDYHNHIPAGVSMTANRVFTVVTECRPR